jgi:hypothetical protein
VTLQNTGSVSMQWRATFSTQQAGVAVSPQQGELAAADSVAIQVQMTTRSHGSHGGSSQQGVISFTPTTPDGGQPAQLTYTTAGCNEQ